MTAEWILEWTPYTANGGTVVTARSAWLSIWLYAPALLLNATLSAGRSTDFSLRQGIADFVDTLPWLGAIFAAVYFAFYARFASQWTYVANLFNQIVQTQATLPDPASEHQLATLASWKAGFIEDAADLHLASKPMFLVAVRDWGRSPMVAAKFATNTVGGADRLEALLNRLDAIWQRADAAARLKARREMEPAKRAV